MESGDFVTDVVDFASDWEPMPARPANTFAAERTGGTNLDCLFSSLKERYFQEGVRPGNSENGRQAAPRGYRSASSPVRGLAQGKIFFNPMHTTPSAFASDPRATMDGWMPRSPDVCLPATTPSSASTASLTEPVMPQHQPSPAAPPLHRATGSHSLSASTSLSPQNSRNLPTVPVATQEDAQRVSEQKEVVQRQGRGRAPGPAERVCGQRDAAADGDEGRAGGEQADSISQYLQVALTSSDWPEHNALRGFVKRPGPVSRAECFIKRVKNRLKGDTFQLYMHHPEAETGARLMLAARKRMKAAVPTFVVALGRSCCQDLAQELKVKTSSSLIATVVGNRQGTSYQVLSSPLSPPSTSKARPCESSSSGSPPRTASPSENHQELLTVRFKQATAGKVGGFRQFCIVLHDPEPAANVKRLQGSLAEQQDAAALRGGYARHGLAVATSIPPKYDEKAKGYVLDFKGRVKRASPKNCQLRFEGSEGDDVQFMFGKLTNDTYAMDFSYPFSILQALGIAIACFDTRSFSA